MKKNITTKKSQEKKLTKEPSETVKKKEKVKKETTKYLKTIGRRKTAIAQVRIFSKAKEKGKFLINKKNAEDYFPDLELKKIVFSPFKKTDSSSLLIEGKIEVLVKGGGKRGQAEAVRLAISRNLVKADSKLRKVLRSHGYLTRDPREKERKKFGLKKARKAPQWQKR